MGATLAWKKTVFGSSSIGMFLLLMKPGVNRLTAVIVQTSAFGRHRHPVFFLASTASSDWQRIPALDVLVASGMLFRVMASASR